MRTTREALRRRFSVAPMRVALEVGTHSGWVSHLLSRLGHEVIVANPRRVALIHGNRRKQDRVDAETLARLARLDPKLLYPVQHRSEQSQADRAVLRARDALVRSRTRLITCSRGLVKSQGSRLPSCSAEAFPKKVRASIPQELEPALRGLLEVISSLTAQIRAYDRLLAERARERYPESALLLQVDGVGVVTALAYMLRIEDPSRFSKSRTLGAYFGLVPKLDQSGSRNPQLRISKEGDAYVRRLLVGCAHYILGPFGKDCELRRYGQRIAERGGDNAKKRAAVAVARKLAVLLHHLWRTAEIYEPFHSLERAA